MFLQFSPPVRQKPTKPIERIEQAEEATLILGPFTATPKIVFENVKVNQRKDEKLVIKNPRPLPIKITATITLNDDINLQINWSHEEILGSSSTCLVLTWTPLAVGSWRSILHIGDGGRFLRDIPVIMKSVSTEKKKITTKKNLPRCVTKRSSPRLKLKKKSPVKKVMLPNITNLPPIKISSPGFPYGGKENIPDFNLSLELPNERRETYIVGMSKSEQVFNDSLDDTAGASFETLLRSHSFIPQAVETPKHNIFNPECCSTDEKSLTGNSITFMGQKLELFKEDNLAFNTGQKESPNLLNISSKTYTKHDTSNETFTKESIDCDFSSMATPSTASQRIRLNSLIGSSVKETVEANLWSNNNNPSTQLVAIKEESSFFEMKQTPIKRKLDVTFTEVAPKRPYLQSSPVKEWAKPKTAPTIDLETAVWLEHREADFKKWLNAVLAPPSDLTSNDQSHPLNVAKLWRQCQKKELETLPPSQVVTSSRLNELRKSARLLYKSPDIHKTLTNVWAAIDCQKLSVREDRDVHLDLAIQSSLMTILLSYNPLWLRLGLETIYRRDIPLRNNSDIVGLTSFLSEHFFKDPLLLKKYKSVHVKNYKVEIKKFILKKFLALIYFLDYAKRKRLIPHDPCLFCKNAPIKESREALLELSRETLSSMGDITKYLRHFKYIVEYKQSYLDEFDYTVNILGVDLRDGVRLTKVLEVILLRTDLSKNLRVPAISRLQKVHNMKMVFDVLEKSNFEIVHEITPKDIVDGHKEKTLSFIWQIIYKFQTPLMKKSATTIIKWWRSPAIAAKREQLREVRKTKEKAATTIQMWYRKKKLQERRAREKEEETKRKAALFEKCVVFVQRKWRLKIAMRNERIKYQAQRDAALVIQRKWRETLTARADRQNFLRLKHFVIDIQRKWRASLMMRTEREKFLLLKSTTIIIQRRFRAIIAMREQMVKFQAQRDAAVVIQRKWKATLAARADRQNFLCLKHFVIDIQRKWRASLMMRTEREKFLLLKSTTIIIQRRFRAILAMREQMVKFQAQRDAAVIIQRKWKATLSARADRQDFLRLKHSVVDIQQKWRAILMMRTEREKFVLLKSATVVIQRRFRATIAMREQMVKFQAQRNAAVVIERRWRATLAARADRQDFLCLKHFVIDIQQRWRAILTTKTEREKFVLLKSATVVIQRRFRATIAMREQMVKFQAQRNAAVVIQRRWRATLAARADRHGFLRLKHSVIDIQQKWRAILMTRTEREKFVLLKSATIVIQRRFRATIAMREQMVKFQVQRNAAVVIQRRWRATLAARADRQDFLRLKHFVIDIQQKWKAILMMRTEREKFVLLKSATIVTQRRFRAIMAMKEQMIKFQAQRNAAVVIQRKWRATLAARAERDNFSHLKRVVTLIQQRWRATLLMKVERQKFLLLKCSAISIQRRFRATINMREEVTKLEVLRKATLVIQRRLRARMLSRVEHDKFQKLKNNTIFVQRKWRAKLAARQDLKNYQALKTAVVLIQRRFRAKLAMRVEREDYQRLRNSAILIQQRFRAMLIARVEFDRFQRVKQATVIIQRKWRATLEMWKEMHRYEEMRTAAFMIQRHYRARLQFNNFQKLKRASILIQRRWRSTLVMRVEKTKYQEMRKAAIVIQRNVRLMLQRKRELERIFSNTVITDIQKHARGYLVRRKFAHHFTEEAKAERKLLRRKHKAAREIQAAWRGYRTRQARTPQLYAVYKKLQAANASAKPQNTLGARCKNAMLHLMKRNISLLEILQVLTDLDFITRRDKKSCLKLAACLPKHLYETAVSTNRSPPEMQVTTVAVSILINFYRFLPTRAYAWIPEYVGKIVTVMLHSCDKEGELFPTICSLIYFFLKNEEYKAVITCSEKFGEKMRQIQEKCERKKKMIAKMNVKYPSFFVPYSNLPLPSDVPDWGIEYKHKPRIFSNSNFAVDSIVTMLNL